MTATATRVRASESSYRSALARLPSHQKTAKGAPAYSRFVNRRLGRHLAALAFATGRTPNQVTGVSATFTFAAIVVLALVRPSYVVALVIPLLLLTGYAFDSADGQLARLRGGGSPAGEWLDHVVDAVKTAALHAAVLISAYRFIDLPGQGRGWLLVPLVYGVVASSWFFTVVLTDLLRRAHHSPAGTPVVAAGTPAPLVRSLLALPTDYGVLCLVFLLLAAPQLFLVGYTLMFVGNVVIFAAALLSWYRELSSFGRAAS